ncbi:MAG TPA: hypothetical protein VFT90_14020, partial [Chryseosolibacter sp.]|nr:hypothetical protein [Chryseosolibacter sp.]
MNNLFVVVFLSLAIPALAQPKARNVRHEMTLLKNALTEHHVEPRKIDNAFSESLFEKIFDDLDPGRVVFTASDIASLGHFRTQLDDEINGGTTRFLDQLKILYRSGLERSERLITSTIASLEWEKTENYEQEAEWVADEDELTDRHRQWLKFQVLDRLMEVMGRDTIVTPDFFEKNIAQAKIYVEQQTLRPIRRLLKDANVYDSEVSNAFLHAIATVFDPHSDFFSASQYDEFVAALSNKDYYFGFMLDEDENGNVVISALAPGGSAWKSGALHVSDVL